MADDEKKPIDYHEWIQESFKDDGIGIGQRADGTLDTFQLSELAEKIRERDREEAILNGAIKQFEADPEPDDLRAEYEETEASEGGGEEGGDE